MTRAGEVFQYNPNPQSSEELKIQFNIQMSVGQKLLELPRSLSTTTAIILYSD